MSVSANVSTLDAYTRKAVDSIKGAVAPINARVDSLAEAVDRIEAAIDAVKKNAGVDGGELPAAARASIDQQLAAQKAGIAAQLESHKNDLQGLIREEATRLVQERLDAAELAAAKNDTTGNRSELASYGERLASHKGIQEFVAQFKGTNDGTWSSLKMGRAHVRIDGEDLSILKHSRAALLGLKADAVMGFAELGPLGIPFHRMTLAELLREKTDIMSMVPRVGVSGADSYDYPRETEESRLGYVATAVAVQTLATDTTLTVDDTRGFTDDTVIRVHGSAGLVSHYITVASPTVLNLFVAPGGAPAQIGIVALVGETVTSENYGATAESTTSTKGKKPVGIYKVERPSVNLKKFATAMILTRNRLENQSTLQRDVNTMLVDRARRNGSFHFLYGDDTDPKQTGGFASDPDVQTYLWSTGAAGDFQADAILRSANQIHTQDTVWAVMNKRDWTTILTRKASDGHYAMTRQGPVLLTDLPASKAIGSFPVLLDGAVRVGDFFMINWERASEWADREDAAMIMGFIDQQLLDNEITMLYEHGYAHAILTPTAYVFGQWDSQP